MPVTEEKKTSAHPRLKKPLTFDRLRAKKPMHKDVTVVLDYDVLDAVKEARTQVERLEAVSEKPTAARTKALLAAQSRLKELEAELEEVTVTLKFQSIGRKRYDALVDECPPTEEQKEEAKLLEQNILYNPDEFPARLIAECCTEPQMTPEEAQEILDEWNTPEVMEIFGAAMEVNNTRRVNDLGKGSGRTAN